MDAVKETIADVSSVIAVRQNERAAGDFIRPAHKNVLGDTKKWQRQLKSSRTGDDGRGHIRAKEAS